MNERNGLSMRPLIAGIIVMLLIAPISIANDSSSEPLGWAQSAGGFESDRIAGHVVMSDESIVVAGQFFSAIQFGDEGIGAASNIQGDADMFLATLDNDGNWSQYIGYGSVGEDGIDAIALHPSGDIVVAGHYCLGTAGASCEINFTEAFSFSKDDDGDEGNAFVARFSVDSSGFNPIWVRSIGNQNDLTSLDISVSSTGQVSVAIFHRGMLEIGGEMIPGDTGQTLAIINYDENGGLLWVNGIGSPSGIEPFGGICHSPDGSLNVVGTFVESVMFIEIIEANGGADIFVAQLDTDGNWTWTLTAGGNDDDWVNDCAVDSNGQVRLVGQFAETASFGHINVTAFGWWDLFHARTTSDGVWEDVTIAGKGGWETLESIVLDEMDNAYVIGSYSADFTLGIDNLTDYDSNGDKRDILLAQMNSDDEWLWGLSAGGTGDDRGMAIQLGLDNSPIAGILFENTVVLGNDTLNSEGQRDFAIWEYARDQDNDGLTDGMDNCPRVPNFDQIDSDGDGIGNECDDDDDNDGIGDGWDDCTPGEMNWYSSPETDHDTDGCQDLSEDIDDDEDGIFDHLDTCPEGPIGWVSTINNDQNQDGCEDVDTDGDGYVDQLDVCPSLIDDQSDLDGDGLGDACDEDIDGDGILNGEDNCPDDQEQWTSTNALDHDFDGCTDEDRDSDDDEDGVLDLFDSCPYGEVRWNSTEDYDGDGCRDGLEDTDEDDDSFSDDTDNCPRGMIGLAGIGMDLDQDGCLDSSEDDDDDNDGVLDVDDDCKYTPMGLEVDDNGCSGVQLDDDNDGVSNQYDLCPSSQPGDVVSSTGCKVTSEKTNSDETKSNTEDSGGFSLSTILFIIAGVLGLGAIYVTWFNDSEDEDEEGEKTMPTIDSNTTPLSEEEV